MFLAKTCLIVPKRGHTAFAVIAGLRQSLAIGRILCAMMVGGRHHETFADEESRA